MSDYQQYLDRKAARKNVQLQAAQVLAEIYKDKGARVQVSESNVYVYLDEMPTVRFKVQPVSTRKEARSGKEWFVTKKYNTTKLSKIVPGQKKENDDEQS